MPKETPVLSNENIHEFRKQIDAVIQKAEQMQAVLGRGVGGRELSLSHTKLQEAKMWAGKILEQFGAPFPAELADKATS